MKKFMILLLLSAMLVSFASCGSNNTEETTANETTDTVETTEASQTTETSQTTDTESQTDAFVQPEDQRQVFKKFVSENEDLKMEIAFEVLASESLGEEAYFTRGENIRAYFYITNISDHSVYFELSDPQEFVGFTEPNEFSIDLKTDDGYVLGRLKGSSLLHQSMTTVELKPGELFMREVCFAAGEYIKGYYVDENGDDCYTDGGFRYYGEDAYKDGKMIFKGTISFWRYYDSLASWEENESKSIECEMALTSFFMP